MTKIICDRCGSPIESDADVSYVGMWSDNGIHGTDAPEMTGEAGRKPARYVMNLCKRCQDAINIAILGGE